MAAAPGPGSSSVTDITGTANHDVLIGTTGDDVIEGLAGGDTLQGREGNDILRGGSGWDELDGGAGDDLLEGGEDGSGLADGAGNDIVHGGVSRDFFYNGSGNDFLYGHGGYDEYQVSRGMLETDTITIEDGPDGGRARLLIAGQSNVVANMGAGDDQVDIEFLGGTATFTLGTGRDTVYIGDGNVGKLGAVSIILTDYELGPAGDRIAILGFMSRNFTGWDQSLSPFLTGYARLVQSGADLLLQFDINGGGNGYSTIITFKDRAAASFDPANLDGYMPDGTIPAGIVIEADDASARLFGLAGGDRIDGGLGDDIVFAGAGDDVVSGGPGQNRLYGEAGNDELQGGESYDEIDGGYGDDEVFGGGGSDYLTSDRGNDLIDGGTGNDRIYVPRGSITATQVEIFGGAGADEIDVLSWGPSHFEIDAGGDDDIVRFNPIAGTADVILGQGSDRVVLGTIEGLRTAYTGVITIADFGVGDVVDFDAFLTTYYNWQGDNPFGNGYFRLTESGANTILELTQGSNAYRSFIVFENKTKASFTADNFLGFSPDGSPPASLHLVGDQYDNLLIGKGGDDLIEGNDGGDSLHGKAGDDDIRGGEGIDFIDAGSGNDRIDGGGGNDHIMGGAGHDQIFGGDGNDDIRDDLGSDVIFGGEGNDKLYLERHYLGGQTVQFYAGGGADSFTLNAGMDGTWIFDGGEGDDRVEVWAMAGTARFWLGAGSDRIVLTGSLRPDPEYGPSLFYVADFDAAADRLDLSGYLSTQLFGWDGIANPLDTGHMRLVQTGGDAHIQIDRDGVGNSHGWDERVILLDFPAASLGTANFGYSVSSLWGSTGDDDFAGGDGNETFRLERGGNDDVEAGGGNDLLFYGGALDAADENDGGAGTDTIVLQGNYPGLTLGALGLVGIEGLSLQSGAVTRWGQTGTNSYDYRLTTANGNVAPGQQLRVNGQSLRAGEDLAFDGSAETDGGRFLVYGGFGADTLKGGAGNDIFFFEAGRFGNGDRIDGGAGNDAVVISGAASGASTLAFEIVPLALTGIESLSFNGRFASDPASQPSYEVMFADGNIAAGATLIVNASSLGAAQSLTFDASAVTEGRLRMFGGAGDDELIGGADGDTVQAGAGADRITGGGMGDALTGGSGADTFVYRSNADSSGDACDLIWDFEIGLDRIDLSEIDANLDDGGNQAFDFVGTAAFSFKAGELRTAYDATANLWTVQGDLNGDGAVDFQLYVSTGSAAPLSATDLIL
jgi:Ca2+-binding RTX toxin-like protein